MRRRVACKGPVGERISEIRVSHSPCSQQVSHLLRYATRVPKSEIARSGRDGAIPASPSVGKAMVGLGRLVEYALAEANISATQYRIVYFLHLGHTIQSDPAFQLAVFSGPRRRRRHRNR
jgi:hypothetical protein